MSDKENIAREHAVISIIDGGQIGSPKDPMRRQIKCHTHPGNLSFCNTRNQEIAEHTKIMHYNYAWDKVRVTEIEI